MYDKKLPLMKIAPPQKKKKYIYIYKFSYLNFYLSEIYKIYHDTYVFEDDKKMKYSKKKLRVTKVVKIQDGHQLWSKICSWYKIN